MIELSVTTKIVLKNESDFYRYLDSDSMAKITGFADECASAYKTKKPLEVKTNRPAFGTVTKSEIAVREIKNPLDDRCFAEVLERLEVLEKTERGVVGTCRLSVVISLLLASSNCYCEKCAEFSKKYYNIALNKKLDEIIEIYYNKEGV